MYIQPPPPPGSSRGPGSASIIPTGSIEIIATGAPGERARVAQRHRARQWHRAGRG